MNARSDRAALRRKHDGDTRPWVPDGRPNRHWYPTDRDQVIDIVKESGPDDTIRAVGSSWSLSPAVCDEGYTGDLIETHDLEKTYHDVIPGCLSPEAARDLAGQRESAPTPYNLVHVGGGMKIYELYSWLDGDPGPDPTRFGPPPDRRHLGRPPSSDDPRIFPWALPTMGGAGGQTIAGAISTSTHGGDQHLAPLADTVVALELISNGGRRHWIQRSRFSSRVDQPLCAPEKLKALYERSSRHPAVQVLSDDEAFNAALVAVGRMGVIVSVVLRVIPQLGLRRWRVHLTWRQIREKLMDERDDLYRHRFLQVVVNPLPRFLGDDHSCRAESRDAIGLDGSAHWHGRDQRTGPHAGTGAPAPGTAMAPALRFLAPKSFTNLGDLVAALANLLARARLTGVLTFLVEAAIRLGQPVVPRDSPDEDHSYAIMDGFHYNDRACLTNVNSIEVAFGGDDTTECARAAIDFVEKSVFRHARAILKDGLAVAAYCSLRWTGRTAALIGIQKWPHTCVIEVAGLKNLSGLDRYLHHLVTDAIAMGGTVHWGQWNDPLDRAAVERMYGDNLLTWRKWLTYFDPDRKFGSQFSERTGLDAEP